MGVFQKEKTLARNASCKGFLVVAQLKVVPPLFYNVVSTPACTEKELIFAEAGLMPLMPSARR